MITIKRKILIIVILPVIVSSALISGSILFIMNNHFIDTANKNLISISTSKIHEIEMIKSEIETLIHLLSKAISYEFNQELYNLNKDQYLEDFKTHTSTLIYESLSKLDRCTSLNFLFSSHVASNEKNILYNYFKKENKYKEIDYDDDANYFNERISIFSSKFKKDNTHNQNWSKPYLSLDKKEWIISFRYPVKSQEKTIGLLILELSLKSYIENLKDFHYLDEGYAFLLDENGGVLYHPSYNLGIPQKKIENNELLPIIKDLYLNKDKSLIAYNHLGKKRRVGYARSTHGWIIGITVTDKEVFIPIVHLYKIVFIIIIGTLLAVIAMALIFSKFIINPIQILNNDIDKVIKNFAYNLTDANTFKRKDEIGKLGKSFYILHKMNNQMIDKMIKENLSLERLANLGKSIGSFTHELMTPLGVLLISISYSQEATEKISSDFIHNVLKKDDFKAALDNIIETNKISIRSIEQAKDIVGNLKDYSKNQSHISWDEINIKNLVINSAKNIFIAHKGFDIVLTLDIDEDLTFYTCSGYLIQVFTNLIQNSFNHGFINRRHGSITIKALIDSGNLVIDYYDNGQGIPHAEKDKIFKKYFTTAKERGGTGLGMDIIRSIIIDIFKGNIEILFDVNNGVHFKIKLPTIDNK